MAATHISAYSHAGRLARFRANLANFKKFDAVEAWVSFCHTSGLAASPNPGPFTFWQRVTALKQLATVFSSHSATRLTFGDGESYTLQYSKKRGFEEI